MNHHNITSTCSFTMGSVHNSSQSETGTRVDFSWKYSKFNGLPWRWSHTGNKYRESFEVVIAVQPTSGIIKNACGKQKQCVIPKHTYTPKGRNRETERNREETERKQENHQLLPHIINILVYWELGRMDRGFVYGSKLRKELNQQNNIY